MAWPTELEVVIDVPRFGFVKRRDDGAVDFVSPLPCPFNYGSVPGTVSGDGDREDAVVLGARRGRGTRARVSVVGRVEFVDAGQRDPKWVCSDHPLRAAERVALIAFFRVYALAKAGLNAARGKTGVTRYRGLRAL